jgi:hypothetical protein
MASSVTRPNANGLFYEKDKVSQPPLPSNVNVNKITEVLKDMTPDLLCVLYGKILFIDGMSVISQYAATFTFCSH